MSNQNRNQILLFGMQEENVKRKAEEKEEHKQRSLEGQRAKQEKEALVSNICQIIISRPCLCSILQEKANESSEDDDDNDPTSEPGLYIDVDDAEYFRQAVGHEPEPGAYYIIKEDIVYDYIIYVVLVQ